MWIVKCRRGTVTVFLVIVFTALLFLAGALIDAARIMLAKNRLQGALDSAVRSTLAGCHANLVGEFGLYGVQANPEVTNKYFLANLQEQNSSLNLVRFNVTKDVEVEYRTNLLNNRQFKEQILQYMKYRAPLAVAENLLARLTDGGLGEKTGVLASGQKTVATREQLNADLTGVNRRIAAARSYLLRAEPELSTPDVLGTREEIRAILDILDNTLEPRLTEYENAVREFNRMSEQPEQDKLPETELLRSKIKDLREKAQDGIDRLNLLETAETKPGEAVNSLQIQTIRLRALLGELEEISWPAPNGGIISKNAVDEPGRLTRYLRELKFVHLNPEDLIPGRASLTETEAGRDKADHELPEPGRDGCYQINGEFAATETGKALSFLSALDRKADDLARGARDSLYLAAYIMDKFTYLTSATPRAHYLQKGEVEYILCGDNSEFKNVIGVCGQIYFMRFALNTLHSFGQSGITHLPARLGYAVLEGLVKAGADLRDLYDGKRVPLYPWKKAAAGSLVSAGASAPDKLAENEGLGYSDHLLLLLLMQDEETQLNRMRNLIQVNLRKMKAEPGFSLASCHTICRAKAEATINLWFAPVLHLDKLGLEKFKDGRYLIVCESAVGF